MRQLLLAAIRLYQRYLSPYKGFSRAYRQHTGRASCSAFGYRAVRRHGFIAGLALIRSRTHRCGIVHRQHHPRPLPPLSQRGMCDLGCDLPCDGIPGGCDAPDVATGVCDALSYCDCGVCDWPSGSRKNDRDK